MASKECCAAGAPVKLEYTKKGQVKDVSPDLKAYVNSQESKRALILVTDIFGLDFNQVFQVADRLADQGFTVGVPDLFGDDAWKMSEFPPPDKQKFMQWIHTKGDVGKTAVKVHQTRDTSYSACACCHPAFFGKEEEYAKAAVAPVCILPAKGDPMEDAKAILDKKPFADKCFFLRFDDQEHGFMAARGDYSKPEIAAAAGKGLEILANFFTQRMAS